MRWSGLILLAVLCMDENFPLLGKPRVISYHVV